MMSALARAGRLGRSAPSQYLRRALRRDLHQSSSACALLRNQVPPSTRRRRGWPFGTNALHNVPAMRPISFARVLPNLAIKLFRIPAMLGGAMITGFAYVQYQTIQAGNYAVEMFRNTSDVVSGTVGYLHEAISGVAEQTKNGWEKETGNINFQEWLEKLTAKLKSQSSSGSGEPSGDGGGPQQSRSTGAAVAGTAAAFGYAQSQGDDERSEEQIARDDQMMVLTKKMIEIRSMLQLVGKSEALVLPSIAVIGSQSSGKSSVLEAIVGHEFLPKGSNMITRRPIELTLVNTPEAQADYGEFPALGLGKITDFSHIQKTLTDLNLAVPAEECVSDDPIRLSIYSPNVPDLSLTDLPGYIQVSGLDQPQELKQKIADLCDKYIQAPNIILAISSADSDLANSTALRASRRVDPRGERTIGVVTKMDLVEPTRGASILDDKNYPLRLGYVGVVSRIPQTSGLFSRTTGNITQAITRNENAYFSAHPAEFGERSGLAVGTTILRQKLMHVLEQSMAASLQGTSDAIHQELEEATYQFKVQYNDRPLSAESYLAESLDAFKHSFKEFTESFGRPQVKDLLKGELNQQVLNILAQRYWNRRIDDLSPTLPEPDPLSGLPKSDSESAYWRRKLDASTSSLTKLGIGRLATTTVAEALQAEIDRLISTSTFAGHPFARQAITTASASILNERFYSTSDQVENCIKPYKYEIEVEDAEWAKGRQHIIEVLKNELNSCEAAVKRVEKEVGGKRKLNDVMNFVDRVKKGETVLDSTVVGGAGGFSAALLARGRDAVFLRNRASILQMRILALKSTQCATKNSKYQCPEIFLDVVADKLTSTAVLFLNVELLSEFYHNFPRELDARLGRHLSDEEVERFAREDPKIKGHLDVVRRKEMLERVLEKMEGLRALEGRERSRDDKRKQAATGEKTRPGGWRLF